MPKRQPSGLQARTAARGTGHAPAIQSQHPKGDGRSHPTPLDLDLPTLSELPNANHVFHLANLFFRDPFFIHFRPDEPSCAPVAHHDALFEPCDALLKQFKAVLKQFEAVLKASCTGAYPVAPTLCHDP